MKKSIVLVLCVCMAMCGGLTACKQENGTSVPVSSEGQQESSVSSKEESSIDSAKFAEEWGVTDLFCASRNGQEAMAYLNFPEMAGNRAHTGKAAYQSDHTFVLVGSEREDMPVEVAKDSCDEVFPAYFEHAKKIMERYQTLDFADFDFSLEESKELVAINGYEMCRYTGTHSYTKNGTPYVMPFVAYATKLKTNGAFIYWIVMDGSEDSSLGDVISDHAEKMAYTLRGEKII